MLEGAVNTDKELWRETEGDYYSNSVHVTSSGGIGINVGGFVRVLTLQQWHEAAKHMFPYHPFNKTKEEDTQC